MQMCNLSAMRTPPLRPSVIAAASVMPPVSQMKVCLCALHGYCLVLVSKHADNAVSGYVCRDECQSKINIQDGFKYLQ